MTPGEVVRTLIDEAAGPSDGELRWFDFTVVDFYDGDWPIT